MLRYTPYWLSALLFLGLTLLGMADACGMFLWLFGYYLLFPATAFFGALFARWQRLPGAWAFSLVSGAWVFLVPVLTAGRLLPESLLFGFVPAVIGWLIGRFLKKG